MSGEQAPRGVEKRSSSWVVRGTTRAATPCGCSVSAMPSKRRSVVVKIGMAISGREMSGASLARWRSPDSEKSTASMRQPEERASSTRRSPSTPTLPDSVGRPPRRAMRKSLSQRLSRLERRADEEDLEGVAIGGSVAEGGEGWEERATSGQRPVDGEEKRKNFTTEAQRRESIFVTRICDGDGWLPWSLHFAARRAKTARGKNRAALVGMTERRAEKRKSGRVVALDRKSAPLEGKGAVPFAARGKPSRSFGAGARWWRGDYARHSVKWRFCEG
jgi:hypothetical protein